MTRKTALIICLIAPLAYLNAQKYQFQYQEKEQGEIESISFKDHFLGEEIAIKMQLMKENYTYRVMDEITRVESTEIEKASIYYSVNKLNKYLKKGIKKGEIEKEQAKELLENVLTVAINIRYQETAELEKELWGLKDPKVIATLYDREIVLN